MATATAPFYIQTISVSLTPPVLVDRTNEQHAILEGEPIQMIPPVSNVDENERSSMRMWMARLLR